MKRWFLLLVPLLLSNCANSVSPSPESTVILSYRYYPVPKNFGDSIVVYVGNRLHHVFYAKDFKLDTFHVPIDKEILTQYTFNDDIKFATYRISSDTMRILVGGGFGKLSR
jgi:hypothetical protein